MTIQEFADLITRDLKISFDRRGWKNLDRHRECATKVNPGKKYMKVDVSSGAGWSGRYMIDAEGNIFGIKSYGVIHKGHRYGTLETTNQYFWGEYHPIKK